MRGRIVSRLLLVVLAVVLVAAAIQLFVYFQVRGSAASAAADAARDAATRGGSVAAAATQAQRALREDLDDRDADAITCTSALGRDANTGLATVTVRCTGKVLLLLTDHELPVTVDESTTVIRQDG